jgi:hypothetical protein
VCFTQYVLLCFVGSYFETILLLFRFLDICNFLTMNFIYSVHPCLAETSRGSIL